MAWMDISSIIKHGTTFSRNFAGSIPDAVIGIFHCLNPSGRTVALGSTQLLTERFLKMAM
jgi:hypothetical protein